MLDKNHIRRDAGETCFGWEGEIWVWEKGTKKLSRGLTMTLHLIELVGHWKGDYTRG